jgi:saccharopine dehydrogenase-like NADP-dependent oxidoreductase
MHVALLGGAGEVGSEIARDLAALDEIESLRIADLDGARADELAAELATQHGGVSALGLDVHNRRAALEWLAGADVLMNCTSFVLFDDVLALAAEASIDYADLISEPTAEHRQVAKAAGITAISGLGASPGLSNVLVHHAADALDELHEVEISWMSVRTVAPTPGLLDTILWELSEDCVTRRYYRDGRHHQASFMEGSRLVDFAPPMGRQYVYYVPHTEVTTLPRHFPTLRHCAVRGSWRPELMQDMRVLQRYGLLAGPALEQTKRALWQRCGGKRDASPWMLFVNVEAAGVRDGEPIRRTYTVSHPADWGQRGVARMTGVTAAVGVQLLARHGRGAAGFVDPEEYYDPLEFLGELARRESIVVECQEAVPAPESGAPPPVTA